MESFNSMKMGTFQSKVVIDTMAIQIDFLCPELFFHIILETVLMTGYHAQILNLQRPAYIARLLKSWRELSDLSPGTQVSARQVSPPSFKCVGGFQGCLQDIKFCLSWFLSISLAFKTKCVSY